VGGAIEAKSRYEPFFPGAVAVSPDSSAADIGCRTHNAVSVSVTFAFEVVVAFKVGSRSATIDGSVSTSSTVSASAVSITSDSDGIGASTLSVVDAVVGGVVMNYEQPAP
jgi:hypothetical protein